MPDTTAGPVRHLLTGRPGVPTPVGPFVHAVAWGDLLFVTGQMPTDPLTGEVVPGGVVAQTRQVMANLAAVVQAAGGELADTLQVRAYLTDFADFAVFNTEYVRWFPAGLPARTCIGVTGLAVGAVVEVDLVVGLRNQENA
ncbi:RidA family protein [Nakamurella flavida]|uniref:RidA family protein n=1 Tax=Nakamurella flavida TaxID=363630 RepID=A0A939C4R6_9ACTN|nr:Rid family hydrolase [Nakamurella flavida]MBM9476009.1 RidA family protein [Nakamurella flavida]MDP9777248.1 reactive intermediate/imine deaminase [Nakamurella flavida]